MPILNNLSLRKQWWSYFYQKSRESLLSVDAKDAKGYTYHSDVTLWDLHGKPHIHSQMDVMIRRALNAQMLYWYGWKEDGKPFHLQNIYIYFWTDKFSVLCIATGTVCDCGRYRRVVGQLNINVARLNTSIKFVKNGKDHHVFGVIYLALTTFTTAVLPLLLFYSSIQAKTEGPTVWGIPKAYRKESLVSVRIWAAGESNYRTAMINSTAEIIMTEQDTAC